MDSMYMRTVEGTHRTGHIGLVPVYPPTETIGFKLDLVTDRSELRSGDIHRDFRGEYHINDGTLAITEIKEIRSRLVTHIAHPRGAYQKHTGELILVDDIFPGAELSIQVNGVYRDRGYGSTDSRQATMLLEQSNMLTTARGTQAGVITYRVLEVEGLQSAGAVLPRVAMSAMNALREFWVDAAFKKIDARKDLKPSMWPFVNVGALVHPTLSRAPGPLITYLDTARGSCQPRVAAAPDPSTFRSGRSGFMFTASGSRTKEQFTAHRDDRFGDNSVENEPVVALMDFIRLHFPSYAREGSISYQDFRSYYEGVRSQVEDDSLFVEVVKLAWDMQDELELRPERLN